MMLKGAKQQGGTPEVYQLGSGDPLHSSGPDCVVCPGCVEEGSGVKLIFVPGLTTLKPNPHPRFPVP